MNDKYDAGIKNTCRYFLKNMFKQNSIPAVADNFLIMFSQSVFSLLQFNFILSISIFAFLVSCSSDSLNNSDNEKFLVTSPVIFDTVVKKEFVAEIQSLQNVKIHARVRGYLEKIHVDEGEFVKAGQLLFSINGQQFQKELLKSKAMVKTAIAEAKSAELEFLNVKTLAEKKIVSQTEFEKAKANLDALNAKTEEAKANEESSMLNLSYTEIKAPFDGIINRIPFKTGSLIDEGNLLTSISNNKEMYAYFNLSEKEYLEYASRVKSSENTDAILLLANGEPHKYRGTVETIEGEFDKSTGNIALRAKFPNPDQLLKHGSSGKIQLIKYLKNALIIPQKATFEMQDKIYVYAIDTNNVIMSKIISIEYRIPHLFIIGKGLTASDKIIYEGIQNVKDGDKIRVEFIPMQQIMKKLGN